MSVVAEFLTNDVTVVAYDPGTGTAGSVAVMLVADEAATVAGLPPKVTMGGFAVPNEPAMVSVVPDELAEVIAPWASAGASASASAAEQTDLCMGHLPRCA